MSRPSEPAHPEPKPDLYSRITNAIIADLQKGVRSWTRPWSAEHLAGRITRPLRATGEPYNGINVVVLWMEATARGYAAPIWITFRQAMALGGHVRKGEHGATVVYANRIRRTETSDEGLDVERSIPFLKAYTVFNAEQVEGLPAHLYARPAPTLDQTQRIGAAETFFASIGADVRHGGDRAYYAIGPDHVRLPPFESFRDPEAYYATFAHESTHWTGHPTRLDRDFGRKRWGDAGYAREELVAELGAAFLCADLGIALEPRPDHAAYIGSWLQVLEGDKRFIVSAAAHAQRAVDFLHTAAGSHGPRAASDHPDRPD